MQLVAPLAERVLERSGPARRRSRRATWRGCGRAASAWSYRRCHTDGVIASGEDRGADLRGVAVAVRVGVEDVVAGVHVAGVRREPPDRGARAAPPPVDDLNACSSVPAALQGRFSHAAGCSGHDRDPGGTAMKLIRKRMLGSAAVAAASLGGTGLVAPALAGDSDEPLPEACEGRPRRTTPIATAKLIIEFNSTDDDIGVHGAFDDHGWSELCVFDPSGRPIAVFDPQGALDDLTMAGVFFESARATGLRALLRGPRRRVPARRVPRSGHVLRRHDSSSARATFTHDVPAPPDDHRAGACRGAGAARLTRATRRSRRGVGAGDRDDRRRSRRHHRLPSDRHQGEPRRPARVLSPDLRRARHRRTVNALSVPTEFLEPDTIYESRSLHWSSRGTRRSRSGSSSPAEQLVH